MTTEKGQTPAARLLGRIFPARAFIQRVFLAVGTFFSHGSKTARTWRVFLDEPTNWRIILNRFIYFSETP